MKFEPTILSGAYVITASPIVDERGWFARSFCKEAFTSIQHTKEWVQQNISFTKNKGSIRGLHFQLPPFSEIKMVACITGSVFDVMVDLRKDSLLFYNGWVPY
jgi:dTDP-4-dehydrorhamnose 3,5-epimerase